MPHSQCGFRRWMWHEGTSGAGWPRMLWRGGGCPGAATWQGVWASSCSCLCGNRAWEWGLCHATWQGRLLGAGLPRWPVVRALPPVGSAPDSADVGSAWRLRGVLGAFGPADSFWLCEVRAWRLIEWRVAIMVLNEVAATSHGSVCWHVQDHHGESGTMTWQVRRRRIPQCMWNIMFAVSLMGVDARVVWGSRWESGAVPQP